ncbi:S8 family serine peptidase [Hamadaea tsunoensis]|uniref:S8 family serine peptidase n=1 Tax=Hamadaea tsunoensis TaxID=53368 RepID=UPI00040FA7A6|nr:S8 family serine peptidase [Hamadaea tsunoensis]
MRLRAAITLSALAAALVALPATPASANCGTLRPGDPGKYQLPKDDAGNFVLARFGLDQLPPRVDGSGVTVAVLDSGVDKSHPALADRVLGTGRDFLEAHDSTHGTEDCRGHGTAVASLIAGNPHAGFRGIAPGASILPIRVNEAEENESDNQGVRPTSDQKIADAIEYAVSHGADVINISFAYTGKDADPDQHQVFAAALRDAIAKDVVVVAATGNTKGASDSFPANQPGVIGVSAVTAKGVTWPNSTVGSFVDISAPGEAVPGAWANGVYAELNGTSFAAPIVSGTVALLKQLHPNWHNDQFIAQLAASADPSPGGKGSKIYGAGVVDPVRACSVLQAAGQAYVAPAIPLSHDDPASIAAARDASVRHEHALWLALGVAAVTVIILFSSAIIANGSRRRWHVAE